ncbi:MAG TPA: hypothetical protein VHT53_05865 [Candidatus Elarobacter sp.]|nr:hypothetical protein [Candidatus Elarobacter sp.]
MKLTIVGRFVASGALVALAGGAALAQTTPAPSPTASPTAAPTPSGFTGRAHANLAVTTPSQPISGSIQLGVAHRSGLTRIDILSVHSDSFPIPPISGTVVIDHAARTLTAWSDTTRSYYVQRFELPRMLASPAPSRSPSPRPRPSASPRPAAPSVSFLRDLDVLSLTVKLLAHTTTAGLPTTGLSLDFMVQKKGQAAPSHVTATTQLADDFAFFPMTLDSDVEPGTSGTGMRLSYAVDSVVQGVPPAAQFRVPAGYAKASSLFAVIMPSRPTVRASPAPH